jgi:hypothetical protein
VTRWSARASVAVLLALGGLVVADESSRESREVLELVCPGLDAVSCRKVLCESEAVCPLIGALGNSDVLAFVRRVALCDGCNLPLFAPGKGLERCAEFAVAENNGTWKVSIWVSPRCSFRYGSCAKVRVEVTLAEDARRILEISPDARYVGDPLYCDTDVDCRCLSGSGVEFVGCANMLHAPLHFAGDYGCELCVCSGNQCLSATRQ